MSAQDIYTNNLDDAQDLLSWIGKALAGQWRQMPATPTQADAETMRKVFYLLHDASMLVQEIGHQAE